MCCGGCGGGSGWTISDYLFVSRVSSVCVGTDLVRIVTDGICYDAVLDLSSVSSDVTGSDGWWLVELPVVSDVVELCRSLLPVVGPADDLAVSVSWALVDVGRCCSCSAVCSLDGAGCAVPTDFDVSVL